MPMPIPSTIKHPRVHDVCKTKLFAIVRLRQFYCRKCRAIITILDEKGNRLGPGINPPITEEQIKVMARTKGTIKPFVEKIIYKLIPRPTGVTNENS